MLFLEIDVALAGIRLVDLEWNSETSIYELWLFDRRFLDAEAIFKKILLSSSVTFVIVLVTGTDRKTWRPLNVEAIKLSINSSDIFSESFMPSSSGT